MHAAHRDDPGSREPVYLDHNATTPVDPRVLEAMLPWLGPRHGNPSSIHRFGQAARDAVEAAREEVAALLGGRPPEVVLTASGTEANNAVVLGLAERAGYRGRLVISALEHPSVRAAAARVEAAGVEVVRVRPRPDGVVDPEELLAAVTPGTLLVALMLANNEVGTLQPVAEVAAACRERGVPVLTDAVQAVGKVPVDAGALGVDFLVLGGHKFHGPPGTAALWVRTGLDLPPLLVGGSQERRRRASTENVPGAVGLGRACALAAAELPERRTHLAALRDRLEQGATAIPGAKVHCAASPRLPNTSHLAFAGVEGEALLIRLDLAGFAVSTGSACASGAVEPSPVLTALGLPRREALSSVRVSFGITNRVEEVEWFLEALEREVAELRRLVPAAAVEPGAVEA
ncbi:MAG TPA: cysteine desulfurase family protein [Thermoanaerobaculia bacterium]|nr:cysteine desulfurase family protein [Thermoanaerobaculia bacterium]